MAKGWFTQPAFGLCRVVMGHAWQPEGAMQVANIKRRDKQVQCYLLTVRCLRCRTQRLDRIGLNSGDVEGRGYTYPEGYRFSLEGEEMPERSTLRKEAIQMLVPKAKPAAKGAA